MSLQITDENRVRTLTLDRPDALNAMSPEMMGEIASALEQLDAGREVGAVVIAGHDRAFAAGADLKAMREYIDHELPKTGEPYNARVVFPVIQRVVASRLPVVAAVNGGATAGGAQLNAHNVTPVSVRVAARTVRL